MSRKVNKISKALRELQIVQPVAQDSTEKTKTANGTQLGCDPAPGNWPKLRASIPPIFLHDTHKWRAISQHLVNQGIEVQPAKFFSKYYKIKMLSYADHKAFTNYFDKNKISYHTYGAPSRRKMKVVIRGLPKDSNFDKIKQELIDLNVPVIRMHKMHTAKDLDRPLLVLAVVPHNDDGKRILLVKKILGNNVKLEPPAPKTNQCHRCQIWGHSQRYCHGKVKCVKCSGNHFSKKCTKDPTTPAKCANCDEDHTANYKECPFCPESRMYKASQARKKRMIADGLQDYDSDEDYDYELIMLP